MGLKKGGIIYLSPALRRVKTKQRFITVAKFSSFFFIFSFFLLTSIARSSFTPRPQDPSSTNYETSGFGKIIKSNSVTRLAPEEKEEKEISDSIFSELIEENLFSSQVNSGSCSVPSGSEEYLYEYPKSRSDQLGHKVSLRMGYTDNPLFYVSLNPQEDVRLKEIEVRLGTWGGGGWPAACKIVGPEGEEEWSIDKFRGEDWRKISFAELPFNERPLLSGGQSYRLLCRGNQSWSTIYWQGMGANRAAKILVSDCVPSGSTCDTCSDGYDPYSVDGWCSYAQCWGEASGGTRPCNWENCQHYSTPGCSICVEHYNTRCRVESCGNIEGSGVQDFCGTCGPDMTPTPTFTPTPTVTLSPTPTSTPTPTPTPSPTPTQPPQIFTWVASDDYHTYLGRQGGEGENPNRWRYQWYDGQYHDMSYATTPWGWKAWLEPKTADHSYCGIAADSQHPGDYQAVRKWIAPRSGQIRITGKVRKSNTKCGDGVKFSIWKNSQKIYGWKELAFNDNQGFDYDLNLNVNLGDAISFRVHQGEAGNNWCDGTYINPRIEIVSF